MNSWNSYPKIYALGHRSVADLLSVDVDVEEKVDGSQFSFGVDESGEIHIRSKGAAMFMDAPEKMFSLAADTVRELAPILHPGWCYRGEYLQKPKHNTLAYTRIPEKHIVLFDIATGLECYASYEEKAAEAARIGLEVVPLLHRGRVQSSDEIRQLLETTSILGGQKIEGVVVKPIGHCLFGEDKKPLIGKFVSEAFKEIHSVEWRKNNPIAKDITELRWDKAVIHLRERGLIQDAPQDIGKLMAEVQSDVEGECTEEIKDALYKWAWPSIKRRLTAGLPEWYKQELLDKQFTGGPTL